MEVYSGVALRDYPLGLARSYRGADASSVGPELAAGARDRPSAVEGCSWPCWGRLRGDEGEAG